jgi:uncharacterized membrane protein YcgQ (UPF0703/DUF1980 family)
MINIFAFLLFWGINVFIKGRKTMKRANAVAVISIFLIAGCGGIADKAGEEKIIAQKVPGKQLVEKQLVETKTGKGVEEQVVEIKEKMFIAQTNDIYLNAEDYMGKTIKLQGLFKKAQYETREAPYCFVLRYGPGCCGYDGNAGFEVAWEPEGGGSAEAEYPKEDDWVEATGRLKSYVEDDYPYLYIALTSLNVLDERGAEFVTQ